MATIDLGKIKQVWRGTYNNGTAYTVDDLVAYTDSGILSTYICVANSTGNAPSSSGTAHASWNYVSKGVADPIPSQSGQAGKFLTTNGSAVSFGAVSQKLIGIGTLRHTQSSSFNVGSTNLNNNGVFYYPNTSNAMLELQYNRQNSSSNLILQGHYTADTSTNFHSVWAFINEDQSIRKCLGYDEHHFGRASLQVSFNVMFTAAELGSFTGNKLYVVGGGTGDNRTHTGVRCPNTHPTYSDTSNSPQYSELTILEVLP